MRNGSSQKVGESRLRLAFLLLVLALSVRAVHLLQIESSLFADILVGDENTHRHWAELVLSGDFQKFTPFFRGPLYGFFLALPLGLFNGSLTAVRLAQMALGSAAVVFTFLLGLELFSPFVALTAGIFLALYPMTVYFEGQLLLTSLFTFLATAGLYFAARTVKRGGGGNGAATGAFLGLAYLTRPTILPFALVLFPVVLRRRGGGPAIQFAGTFLAMFLVTPAVNFISTGRPTLFPTQGGINFRVGNAGSADGVIPAAPSITLQGRPLWELRERLGPSLWLEDNMYLASRIIPNAGRDELLTDSETSSWWYAYTMREIVRDPGAFFSRMLRKCVFLAGAWEPPNNTDPEYVMTTLYPFLGGLSSVLSFFLLWACCLPGLWLAWERYPGSRFLPLYLLMMSLVILAFFVTSRFRVPLVPVMALYLGVAAEWALGRDDPGRFRRRTARIAGALFLAALVSSQLYRLYGKSYPVRAAEALMHHTMAQAYLQKHDADAALREISLALDEETRERYLYLRTRALIESRLLHEPMKAAASLEESLALVEHPVTLRDLAVLHAAMGRAGKAAAYLERSLALEPGHPGAIGLLEQL